MLRVPRAQAVNYRLLVNNLSRRLPASSYVEAAYAGLQDTGPRDALVGMHAPVEVHVLPAGDFGVFTVGRLPRGPQARQVLEDLAEEVYRALEGQERRQARWRRRPGEPVRPC